jgi:hypothetical protein
LQLAATTISLSPTSEIEDLQVRLYGTAGNPNLPVLGNPSGTTHEGWTSQISFSRAQTVSNSWVNPTRLPSGTHVLQVRDNVLGAAAAVTSVS